MLLFYMEKKRHLLKRNVFIKENYKININNRMIMMSAPNEM